MRLAPLIALLLALLMAVAVVEGATRILLPTPRFHLSGLELDADLGFRGVPGHVAEWVGPIAVAAPHEVRLNAEGFRGRELPATPRGAGPDVLFLGDSFLVGEAVPESALVTSRVEAALRATRPEARVYNLSAVDYGTGQQLLLFDRVIDRFRPETVVLSLYPTNDVANNAFGLAGRTRVSPGDAIRPYVRPAEEGRVAVRWVRPFRSALRRFSHAFAQIERGFFPPSVPESGDAASAQVSARAPLPRPFLEVFRAPSGPDDPWAIAWQETEDLIRALRDRCAARGARLVVVVIPSVHQVGTTASTVGFDLQLRAGGRSLEDALDWEGPESRLAAFGAREGIEFVPLLPVFREARAAGEVIYTRDQHLSTRGHGLMAQTLFTALTSEARGAATIDGSPARVVWRGATNPDRLGFRRRPHRKHLSDGWIEWRPSGAGRPGGWRIGRRGAIALRAGDGPLVLEGFASKPLSIDFAFIGSGPARRAEVAKAGPFTLRLPVPNPLVRTAAGQTALLLDVGADVGQLSVQSVGFARPISPRGPAPRRSR